MTPNDTPYRLAVVAVDRTPGLQGYAKWLASHKIALSVSSDGLLFRVALTNGNIGMINLSAIAGMGPGKLGCIIELLISQWEVMYG